MEIDPQMISYLVTLNMEVNVVNKLQLLQLKFLVLYVYVFSHQEDYGGVECLREDGGYHWRLRLQAGTGGWNWRLLQSEVISLKCLFFFFLSIRTVD